MAVPSSDPEFPVEVIAGDLSTAVVSFPESACLGQLDNSAVESGNQMSNSVFSLSPPNMSNLVNFGEWPTFYDIQPETNIQRDELHDVTSDLDSLLGDLNVKPITLTADMATIGTDSITEQPTMKFKNNDLSISLSPETEFIDLTRCFGDAESFSFDVSDLESETFHNIEDFVKQNLASALPDVIVSADSEMVDPSCSGEEKEVSSTAESSPAPAERKGSKRQSTNKSPHEKYLEMRRKNNIASRRSRQMRKEKIGMMSSTIAELENENQRLKCTVAKMEKQKDLLQSYLMKIFKKSD